MPFSMCCVAAVRGACCPMTCLPGRRCTITSGCGVCRGCGTSFTPPCTPLPVSTPGVRWVWVGPGQEPPTIPRGFQVLPRRWVVERTFAWLVMYRRLAKDYEELPATSEALIYLAMSRLMVKRLAHA